MSMTSVFRCEVPGPAAGNVKVHLVRDCEPDITRDLPRMDEVFVLSYTDGSAKVAVAPNLNLDETVEVMVKGDGTVEQKMVRGRTIYTLVPNESKVLDGDKLVELMKRFVHLAQRQDPEVLRAEWEARQERRERWAQQPPTESRGKGGGAAHASAERATLVDAKGGDALKRLKPPVLKGEVQAAPALSPAQRVNEKASEVIARLMATAAGQNAVTAARMACGVSMAGPIPAAKLKEVAEMAEVLV